MSATQVLSQTPYEENPNLNFDTEFEATPDYTTSTHIQNTAMSFEPYSSSNSGDLEFSADFSPETLTRVNASSSGHENGVWYEIPQQWQDLACVPVKEPEIVGFRMGVNTCLSVGDLGVGYGDYLLDREEGMEVGSVLGTADEVFWIRSTTRRPAPGTEWEFENRAGCVGREKGDVGSTCDGLEDGSLEDSQERGSEMGAKEVAVERLKSILAHLEN